METATFGAGCFWGVESVFEQVDGVTATKVGYTGGFTQAPSYEDVCSHRTGHAEAVEVTFDPARVSYDTLLDIFWMNHDPTQLNRQGPDVGDNYRSVIFFHSPEQEAAAIASKKRLEESGRYRRPIVTEIVPAGDVLGRRGVPPEVLLPRGHRRDLQHPGLGLGAVPKGGQHRTRRSARAWRADPRDGRQRAGGRRPAVRDLGERAVVEDDVRRHLRAPRDLEPPAPQRLESRRDIRCHRERGR